RANSPYLRQIFQEIFVAVRESDNALRAVWGPEAPTQPKYRETLNDIAVCLNAAHTAFSLRQQVEAAGIWNIEVLFGAYDVCSYQVCMPIHPDEDLDAQKPELVNLAHAPSHPREFGELAARLATTLRRPGTPVSASGQAGGASDQ